MVRLAANLSMMFQELPFLARFEAAKNAGFRAVEFVSPYEEAAGAVATELSRLELELALFNFPPGDWAAGDRGIAANPSRRDEFRDGITLARKYIAATGCKNLHLMAGKLPAEADRRAWRDTLVENVRMAADALAEDGATVVLEAINTRIDIPDYFYATTGEVAGVMDEIRRPNVKLLADLYHMQIMEGDLARSLDRLMPRIAHVQIADNPGRHEPGTGEINYAWLLTHLASLGYQGFVGCEYRPKIDTLAGLGWAAPWLVPSERERC